MSSMQPMGYWSDYWKAVGDAKYQGETYNWKFYQMLLGKEPLKGRKVLEMGCGTGLDSIQMGMRGAKLSFMDLSEEALKIVRKNLKGLKMKGETIKADFFKHRHRPVYDIVHSTGTVEHFTGKLRQEAINIHAKSLKPGGVAVIIVPHTFSPAYRLGKFLAEATGTWIYGKEYHYTKTELVERVKRAGLVPEAVIGGEGLMSLLWLFSPLFLGKGRMIRKGIVQKADEGMVRLNYNNFLSNNFGRMIGIRARKPKK